jgi:hypothetical protein
MTYHNKDSIVNKIIKNNKFTDEAKSESYGILFMYEKNDGELDDLNKKAILNLVGNQQTIITSVYEMDEIEKLEAKIINIKDLINQ